MFVALTLTVVLGGNAQWLGPKPPAPAQLTRVITAAPSVTEAVLALDAGGSLVGVSRFDEFPQVKDLPRIGGFNDVAVEAVVALKPQLLIVQKSPGNQKPIETLAALGIPVLALPLSTLADVNEMLKVLGTTLGKTAKADQLISEIAKTRAAVQQRSQARKKKPTALLVYGFAPLVVAGPGTFADELLKDLGVTNLAGTARTAYPVFSTEKLIAHPPDLLIDGADVPTGAEELKQLPQLTGLRWVSLPEKDLLHPGPALAKGLLDLETQLFPLK